MKKRTGSGDNILVVTRNFPPLVGGMEKLLFNIYLQISKYWKCYLVGPFGCRKYIDQENSASEVPIKPLLLFFVISFIKSFTRCLINKPTIIIGGSGFVAPIVVILGRFFSVKTIIFVHGLDLVADNYIFQKVFLPLIGKADYIISNSTNTRNISISKGIPPQKITIMNPGVDVLNKGESNLPSHEKLRNKYNLQGSKILLSVGRLVPRKGLVQFIKNSFMKILEECPDYRLVIIGGQPKNALNQQGSVLDEIKLTIASYNLEEKVLLLGSVDNEVLKNAYQESDAFIFPLLDIPGDVEGFGMVAVEAASYCLPVFAFNSGGVRDAIIDGVTGFLVPVNDYETLSELIIEYFISEKKMIAEEACLNHAKMYSWERFGERLREFLAEIN